MVDAMGSLMTPKLYFKDLRAAGGKVEFYHPMRWNTWMRSNNRTHRELMIIDGSTGFIGGAGIADQWWKDEPPKDPRWRDEVFRVKGDAVRALQSTFVENWLEASGELLAGETFYPPQTPSGTATSMVVTSTPSQGGSTRARVLFQTLVASAHKSIQITTPYFLPDTSLREELVKARQRGVEVRILLPGRKERSPDDARFESPRVWAAAAFGRRDLRIPAVDGTRQNHGHRWNVVGGWIDEFR